MQTKIFRAARRFHHYSQNYPLSKHFQQSTNYRVSGQPFIYISYQNEGKVPATSRRTFLSIVYPSISLAHQSTFNPFSNFEFKYNSNFSSNMSTASTSSSSKFPVTATLTTKLTEEFQPSHLDVINESHMHNV